MTKIGQLVRRREGESSVSLIFVSAALLFLFAMLVTALIYVMAYYNAAFLARKVVRSIEMEGQYCSADVDTLLVALGSNSLSELTVTVDADYYRENKIQLRDTFVVSLSAEYPIGILSFGADTVYLTLPIRVQLRGMSEVYWR